jgi:hypothetical protein
MALSSGSKKSTQSDSDSDSGDEVRDELPFLCQENERLGSLLDNRDDILREAKKMRKELRASLEDARTRGLQTGESQLFGPDIIKEAERQVEIIWENLKTAQSRQKSYADPKR